MEYESKLQVTIAVAVNENGFVKCCVQSPTGNIQLDIAYDNFMEEIRQDKYLWHLRSISTFVPMPVSYEITNQNKGETDERAVFQGV